MTHRRTELRAPFVRIVTLAALTGTSACDEGALYFGGPDARPDARPEDALVDDVRDDGGFASLTKTPAHGAPKPRPLEQTVGDPCDDDVDCSPAKTGANFCSNDDSFSYGTLYPTPVCLGRSCDLVPGQPVTRCDAGHGVCVENTTVAAVCLPACTFDGSGAPPRGCLGLDACIALGLEAGAGVGYCLGGCVRDEDCTQGDVCQRDLGFCVQRPFERTMDFGVACTAGSNPPEVECNCLFPAQVSARGYCTQFCRVGDARTTCPSGHRCSAQMPASLGTKEPAGMGGYCLRECATDDECAPINAFCDHTLAGGAVCVPGERRSP